MTSLHQLQQTFEHIVRTSQFQQETLRHSSMNNSSTVFSHTRYTKRSLTNKYYYKESTEFTPHPPSPVQGCIVHTAARVQGRDTGSKRNTTLCAVL
eukprot:sb/3479173/